MGRNDKKPTILMLEDSRADRARFRLLYPGKETEYEFAWAWGRKNGCGVLDWFEREALLGLSATSSAIDGEDRIAHPGKALRHLLDGHDHLQQSLSSFELLLLDLAWTNRAEAVMQELQHMSRRQGHALANDVSETNSSLQSLINKVEGIGLLEWFRDHPKINQPTIWVTSAYVPMTALGIREFLHVRYGLQGGIHLFHKWMDEAPLVSDLISFRNGLKKKSRGDG